MPLASLDHGAITATACAVALLVAYPTLWGAAFAWRQRPRSRGRTRAAGPRAKSPSRRMGNKRA